MEKIKNWFKNEFWVGYNLFEKLFLLSMLLLQIVVYIIVPDTVIGIISGISGVISVVLCAKGKISFYFIGFVQTTSYLYLAWINAFYGEVIENIFYLVTMVWGIFLWKKNIFPLTLLNKRLISDVGSVYGFTLFFSKSCFGMKISRQTGGFSL